MVLPTVGCSLLHQLVIKIVPHRHIQRPVVLNFPSAETFNTVLHVVVTPNHKIISLVLYTIFLLLL